MRHSASWHFMIMLSVIMLTFKLSPANRSIMLHVIIQNVVVLNVIAPLLIVGSWSYDPKGMLGIQQNYVHQCAVFIVLSCKFHCFLLCVVWQNAVAPILSEWYFEMTENVIEFDLNLINKLNLIKRFAQTFLSWTTLNEAGPLIVYCK